MLSAGCSGTIAQGPQKDGEAGLPNTRPNVVLIMTDDQGYGDFSSMGNTVIQTPHLDALRSASAEMSDFYVAPVCSPTRASLMTGRYHMRTQCIDTWMGRSMMATDEVTLAEALRGAGYATGIYGKWHLGDNYPMRPSDQGFEDSLVHRGGGIGQPADPRDGGARYTDPVLLHNDREVALTGYCADLYFDYAINFARQAHARGRPFFAYIATNTPHSPLHDVPEDLRQHYAAQDLSPIMDGADQGNERAEDSLARIAAMVGNIDNNVGKLIAALEAEGLLDNTIIIYLNDNGPNTRRFVGSFRGKKSEVFEGGIRSPLWVRWDGHLTPGHTATQVAAHIDVMPTLLDACGIHPPTELHLDGRSLLPALMGDATLADRPIIIQAHRGSAPSRYNNFMIRDGDWKLLCSTRPWGREHAHDEPVFELYNLADDPGETNNLIDDAPEQFAAMRSTYDEWFDDVSASFADREFPQRIVIDPEHENPSVLTWQDWVGGGWSTDRPGEWLLEVANPGRYDVRVETVPNRPIGEDGWTARLTVGDTTYERPMPAHEQTLTFEAVELPDGPITLRAVMVKDGQVTTAFYHVRLIGR